MKTISKKAATKTAKASSKTSEFSSVNRALNNLSKNPESLNCEQVTGSAEILMGKSRNTGGTIFLAIALTFLISLASAQTSKPPFVHWELMSDDAEDWIGDQPYIYVLPATYQTDGSAAICVANLQHSADVANGSSDTNRAEFPYIKYELRKKRFNTWVYISVRLIPDDTSAIKAWMLQTARAYHAAGLKVDSSTAATILKLKWTSTALQPQRMGDESLRQSSFQIYPNPSDGRFIIDLNAASASSPAATIEVLNAAGQQVHQQDVPVSEGNLHQEIQLPCSAPAGIYFVKVTLNDRVYTRQIRYQK
jgi:hypothetical protein